MKYLVFLVIMFGLFSFIEPTPNQTIRFNQILSIDTIPVGLPATFMDDYGIKYAISDTLWLQQPKTKYHILRWNKKEQYLIARNGMDNSSDKGLYTRIDYVKFEHMEPYLWGFCLSIYKASSDSLAEFGSTNTDKLNPRKGCNGFPFSRMKKTD